MLPKRHTNGRNVRMKNFMYKFGLCQWEVAEAMKVHSSTLCRWLRYDLSEEREREIASAVVSLANEKGRVRDPRDLDYILSEDQ